MFYIYLIKNCVTNRHYIGKTKNLKQRWAEHQKIARRGRKNYDRKFQYLHAAMRKYGASNFEISILHHCPTEHEAHSLEQQCIRNFKKNGCELYNLTDGGEGVSGRPISDEYRAKMSTAGRGRKHTDETKNKIASCKLGVARDAQTRRKMSESKLGSKNHMFGKKHSQESRNKMALTKRGENHPNAKLSWAIVTVVRELHLEGKSYKDIAALVKLTPKKIGSICRNECWKQ